MDAPLLSCFCCCVVDILFLSIIYFADKDVLIIIRSDESLDHPESGFLASELSSLVSKGNVVL